MVPAKKMPEQHIDLLDLCSSWVSHLPSYPPVGGHRLRRVVGHGMHGAELQANPVLTERIVRDLNQDTSFPELDTESLDAVICTVSIDYLIRPQEVLTELYRVLRPGGRVHLGFSNRFFPTKVSFQSNSLFTTTATVARRNAKTLS